uniref:Uncharacterized protein n=1 Tax=Arundo donax TaxID=35708 RepID=A0A0A9G0K0_ARUDO
MLLRCSNH